MSATGGNTPVPRGEHAARGDLKAYLDGELSALRRWSVRAHLSRCAFCREEAAWLTRLGKNMKDLERAQPRPELRARILASLPDTPPAMQGAEHSLPNRTLRRNLPRLAFAGGLAVLAIGGVFALRSQKVNAPAPQHVAQADPQPVPAPPVEVQPSAKPSVRIAELSPSPGSDGTYAEANALFRQRIAEHQKQEQLRAKMLARAARQKAEANESHANAGPIQVALVVEDMSAAHEQIRVRMQAIGGQVEPAASGQMDTLRVRVPSEHAQGLWNALRPVGKLQSPTADETEASALPKKTPYPAAFGVENGPAQAGNHRAAAEKRPAPGLHAPAVIAETSTPSTPLSAMPSNGPKSANGQVFVTLVIHLKPQPQK